jgi:uncharacterized protein (DUF488 family)
VNSEAVQLFSIGHSNVPVERFIALLRQHAIATVCDVRSAPWSRFAPQFNRRAIDAALHEAGITYMFMGAALGGKPDDPALRTEDGAHADYRKIAASPAFMRGIAALIAQGRRAPTAFMCSEADYRACHRHRLLVPELAARGVRVAHILADGSTVPGVAEPQQIRMF